MPLLPACSKSKTGPSWLLSKCSASSFAAAARKWTANRPLVQSGKARGRQLYLTRQIKPRLGPTDQRFFRDGSLSSPEMACLCSLYTWVGILGMGFWSADRLWPWGMQLLYVHMVHFRGFEGKHTDKSPIPANWLPRMEWILVNNILTDYPLQPACGPPPPQVAGVWCCEKVIDGNVSIYNLKKKGRHINHNWACSSDGIHSFQNNSKLYPLNGRNCVQKGVARFPL